MRGRDTGCWRSARACGRIVVPLRIRGLTRSVALERDGACWRSRSTEYCGFVPLRGAGHQPERNIWLDSGGKLILRIDEGRPTDGDALRRNLGQAPAELWTDTTVTEEENKTGLGDLDYWLATQPSKVLDLRGHVPCCGARARGHCFQGAFEAVEACDDGGGGGGGALFGWDGQDREACFPRGVQVVLQVGVGHASHIRLLGGASSSIRSLEQANASRLRRRTAALPVPSRASLHRRSRFTLLMARHQPGLVPHSGQYHTRT
ncbi:MAG: hypothetical protein ACRDTD_07470 [Pseudonocardiaceae bacterium]